MSEAIETWDFELGGQLFSASTYYDDSAGRPWQESECHGPVRHVDVLREGPDGYGTGKRPGEVVLGYDGRRGAYLYDWQAAMDRAKREGWNAAPYDAPGRAERAVQADVKRLRDWLNDRWHYVGVVVRPVCKCCGTVEANRGASLWLLESDDAEGIQQAARDLAADLLPDPADATVEARI